MHEWRGSLSHAAGLVERPLEFGIAKAGAREMVLGETSDEATGSSGDVARTNTKFGVTTQNDDMVMAALAVVGAVAIHKR